MSSPWQSVDLRRYLIGRFLGTLAVMMQSVAVGWQVYDLTRDPRALGWVGLAQFLPMLLLVVPAGDLADRYDRRKLIAVSSVLQAVCSAILFLWAAQGEPTVSVFIATLTLYAVGRAFTAPASRSFIPTLVPPEQLPAAAALSSSFFQTAFILGPALGGLLYGLGPQVVYATSGVLALASVVCIATISVRPEPPPTVGTAWFRVREGVRFMARTPMVLGAVSLDLFAVLLGGATALLPVYAADVLHVGSFGLGVLRAAPSVGALAVNMWLVRSPPQRHVGLWMFGGVGLFGLATIGFGLSTRPALSFAFLLVMGGADMVSVWVRSTLIPLVTPRAMLGRVSAVEMLFIGASNELGEFESGTTAGWFGTVPAVILGGLGTLLVTVTWAGLFPALRKVDRFDQLRPPA